ncbi:hypothetical protein KY290_001906 [Solanum tuberosum]|uniref:Uncharacterized protein n=1 Tax=Solanum tuberosum TaxID=4113 RepID=A0ABQ7WQH2_SOLTU|nr:hypothetical protein KY290_001906 [Solanum tuberosum]
MRKKGPVRLDGFLCPSLANPIPAQQHSLFVRPYRSRPPAQRVQPLLNRNKKELITTACEQLSST